MKRRHVIALLAAAAVLLLLLAGALVVLPSLVDVNRHRPRLEQLARERLGRDVHLGELGLSLLPGVAVTVDGLTVDAKDGSEPLLAARQVRVSAPLAPLLRGRLSISGLTLVEPQVNLRRDAEGRWDVGDLVEDGGAERGSAAVTLDRLDIAGGRVRIRDETLQPGRVVTVELRELDAHLRGLSEAARQVSLRGVLATDSLSSALRFEGSVTGTDAVEGTLEVSEADLEAMGTLLAGWGVEGLAGWHGVLDTRLEGELSRERLEVDGSVEVTGLRAPGGSSAVDAVLGVTARRAADGATAVPRAELRVGATTFSGSGELRAEGTTRTFVAELSKSRLRLADVDTLAKALGTTLPNRALVASDALSAGGKVRLTFEGTGEDRRLERVDLDRVRLSGASLVLRRGPEGRFAFQGPRTDGAGRASKDGPDVAARDVVIEDLAVRVEDRSLGPKPVVTELADVSLRLDAYVPGRRTKLDFSARVASGTLRVSGEAGPVERGTLPVDAVMELDAVQAEALAPYLRQHAGLAIEGGTLSGRTTLRGTGSERLAVSGHLAATGARLEIPGRPPVQLDVRVDHDLVVLKGGDRIDVAALRLRLPGGVMTVDGWLERGGDGPARFDLGTKEQARLTTDDLRFLTALAGADMPVELEAEEPVAVHARLVKSRSGLRVNGQAGLRKVVVRHRWLDQPLQVASADVGLDGETVSFRRLQLRLGRSDLAGDLTLRGFERHAVEFDLRSREADLDELFAFADGGPPEAGGAAGGGPSGADHLALTEAHGRLQVDRATLGGLRFDGLSTRVSLKGRQLVMDELSVGLYEGRATGDVRVDLAGDVPSYRARVGLADVALQPLLTDGLGYGELRGRGGGQVELSGPAGSVDAALAAVSGTGQLLVRDGHLGGLDVLRALEDAQVFGERSLAALGSRLAEEGTTFSRLDARLSVGGGRLLFERVEVDSPDAQLTAKGPVGLIDQRLDLDAQVLFSRELSERMRAEGSRAASLCWDPKQQRVRLPTRMVGTVQNPKATIDWEELASRLAQRELEAEADRRTGGLLGALLGRDRPAEERPPTPAPSPSSPPLQGGDTAEPPADRAEGGPRVPGLKARFSGNFLVPDITVEATLEGRDLSHAVLVVKDPAGKEVFRDEQAFSAHVRQEVVGAAKGAELRIQAGYKVPGKRVAGVREPTVEVTAVTSGGARGPTATARVAAKKLF